MSKSLGKNVEVLKSNAEEVESTWKQYLSAHSRILWPPHHSTKA